MNPSTLILRRLLFLAVAFSIMHGYFRERGVFQLVLQIIINLGLPIPVLDTEDTTP
ncbi:hypothetical protein BMS3Bbin04_01773 [bacterium BMS3Bbin04]|nr:hypothetical protein BMS3Bbin04_01773 [bacterium BMS3Bbin04]